jgi:hypothetical protein
MYIFNTFWLPALPVLGTQNAFKHSFEMQSVRWRTSPMVSSDAKKRYSGITVNQRARKCGLGGSEGSRKKARD